MGLFAGVFQLLIGVSLWKIAEAHRESVQALAELDEDAELESVEAFGTSWAPPLARIDYGSYHQKNRDAEALCIIVRSLSVESKSLDFDCE